MSDFCVCARLRLELRTSSFLVDLGGGMTQIRFAHGFGSWHRMTRSDDSHLSCTKLFYLLKMIILANIFISYCF
jgi:hypothetical protein